MPTHNSGQQSAATKRWVEAAVLGLLFLLFASPFMLKGIGAAGSSIGMNLISKSGCPTMGALLLAAGLFTLTTWGLMDLKY